MITKLVEHDTYFAVLVLRDATDAQPVLAFPVTKTLPEADGTIFTTRGFLSASDPKLERRITFEENENEFIVAPEWWYNGNEMVRRDCHVILKKGSIAADAIAASIG